eukprot:GILJ01003902.1.p1 GENE.GILJ01003902.1~~GILJ01003902.1.p1  ORF type:complete len:427 (-),score=74.82 GILJ01003902.1:122-1312(-)
MLNALPSSVSTGWNVSVGAPESRKGRFGEHTEYCISGSTPSGETFSSYRRFKDFMWLRDQLEKCYPGVFIPALPPKQSVGRFEQDFISMRMKLLHRFLLKVCGTPMLQASVDVKKFFMEPDATFEATRKERSSLPRPLASEILANFKQFYEREIEMAIPGNVSELFLEMIAHLKTLETGLNNLKLSCAGLADTNKAFSDFAIRFGIGLRQVQDSEDSFAAKADMPIRGNRFDASNVFKNVANIAKAIPDRHYQVLSIHITTELMDITAMKDALATREEVLTASNKQRDKVLELTATLEKVVKTGKAGFFSKEMTIPEREAEVAQARIEEAAAKELVEVIQKVLFHNEFQKFRHFSLDQYKRTLNAFATAQLKETKQALELWQQLESDVISESTENF